MVRLQLKDLMVLVPDARNTTILDVDSPNGELLSRLTPNWVYQPKLLLTRLHTASLDMDQFASKTVLFQLSNQRFCKMVTTTLTYVPLFLKEFSQP